MEKVVQLENLVKKLLLGITGEMGCGKGAATTLVKEWYPGTPSFRFSDSLRAFYADLVTCIQGNVRVHVAEMITRHFGGGISRYGSGDTWVLEFGRWLVNEFVPSHDVWSALACTSDLQQLSTALRRCLGGDILERAIIARVNTSTSKSPIIILDGIRRQRDIATLVKDPSVTFGLLYIEVDAETRYARHKARAEKPGDANLTYEEFLELGQVEAERDIVRLRPLSNAIIDNSGDVVYLKEALAFTVNAWLTHGPYK